MLQYFENNLPSVESLWSSLQDKVYFIDGHPDGGLWCYETWLPSWSRSCILLRIKSQVKTARNGNFSVVFDMFIIYQNSTWISNSLHFMYKIYFIVKRSWKKMYFHSKIAWTPGTYDVISVTIVTDHQWTCIKMLERDFKTNSYWKIQVLIFNRLEKLGKSSEKKKTLKEVTSTPFFL